MNGSCAFVALLRVARVTFEFRDGDAFVLDYEDYH